MKKVSCLFLSLALLICFFPLGVFSFEGKSVGNYALGAKYVYDSDVMFLSSCRDENTEFLTDGVVSYEEKTGETVAFTGTGSMVSLIIDLGEIKTDISKIVFRGVCDLAEHNAGNRGFSKDKTKFFFSEDEISYNRNKNFTMTSERKGESYFYDFSFTFDEPVSARCVRIIMYSPVYILSLSEIEIGGKNYYEDESGIASEEESEAVSEESEAVSVESEAVSEESEAVSEESEDVSEEVTEEIIDEFFAPTYRVNYALGAEYVYESENNFLSIYADTEKLLLTDGKISYKHPSGENVAFTGSGSIVSLIIDLGIVRDNVESVFFGGVINNCLENVMPANRGFSEDKTLFYFSENGIDFEKNQSFTMKRIKRASENFSFYDYDFTFDAPVCARYVKIIMYSPVYILSLSEIKVLGAEEKVVDKGEFLSNTKWRYTEKGTLVFSGSWEDDKGAYLYPWEKYNDTVKRIVAEDGVSYIGKFSECSELEEVYMASSVKSFVAFSCCEKLYAVRLSKNITEIPNWAFDRCTSLENIKFHEGLVSIRGDAFENCVKLKEAILPSTLEKLEFLAFFGCSSLEKVELNSKIEKICGTAFLDTKIYNDQSNWDGGVFYLEDIAMLAPWYNTDEEITIKSGTRVIAADAFMDLENLKKIIIPDTVVYIGDGAFYGCGSLETVNIPCGITEILPYTFGICSALKEISLPDGVIIIGEYAFTGSGLEKIIAPDSLQSIGKEAFAYCLDLFDVKLGEKCSSISYRAFYECPSLASVTIPENVISIGEQAFGYCFDELQEGYVIYGMSKTVAEKYALENGIKFIGTSISDELYLDVDSKTIPNLKTQTTVEQIKAKLSATEICDKNGIVLGGEDWVGTGSIVKLENGEEYTAIVRGDVNGDAEIDTTDYMKLKATFLGILSFENEFFLAADMDKDNEITSTDYLNIKSFFIVGDLMY